MTSRTRELSAPTQEAPTSTGDALTVTAVQLTILHHPDPKRVGDRALVPPAGVALSRAAPDFVHPSDGEAWPIADAFVSRTPIHVSRTLIRRPPEAATLSVDGKPLEGERVVGPESLRRGVVLELGGRVVLLLHELTVEERVREDLGLVGESAAMHTLRRSILQVAPTPVPVLLRGETGSGKELAAQALHRASKRAGGPCLSVNLAAIAPSIAASELFGHQKGAFTGASGDHEGLFARASGGTLFLDEIGEAPVEVQVMLLRTLETGLVRPVGAAAEIKVDVRLITATDADLTRAADEGRFRPALLHRLAGYEIHLPPLRERLDDLGILLTHFLREELSKLGVPDRLSGDPKTPWLSSAIVARLARYDWPGNVRQLRNVARHLAISGRDAPTIPLDERLERLLPALVSRPEGAAPAAAPAAPAPTEQARRKPSEVTEEELLTALRKHRFRLEPTAHELRITRPSLYMLIDKSTRLRKAKDIPKDELLRVSSELGGDVERMAERLEVSSRGLYLRLKELERGS